MKYNKKYDIDFPDEIVSFGDYNFFYKTYLGKYNSKKVGSKSSNKVAVNNTPLLGFEIIKVVNQGRYSNSKKEILVIIKHPTLGFIFEVPIWDFSGDILLSSKIENGRIQSECVIGFSRKDLHYPIRLIPITSDKYKDAQTLSTLPVPTKTKDLIEGAKYKFSNSSEENDVAVYIGTIPDGTILRTNSWLDESKVIAKIPVPNMLVFQSCNDPKDIYLLNTITDLSIIETVDISDNIKGGLDISLLNCTVLNSLYCKPKEMKIVSDGKSHLIETRNPLIYNNFSSNTTELFLYQESPTKIILVQEFMGNYFNRGKFYINSADNVVFERSGSKKYIELGYCDRNTLEERYIIDGSCSRFKEDPKSLISIDVDVDHILYSISRNNIKLYNDYKKELPVFRNFPFSWIHQDCKINIDKL